MGLDPELKKKKKRLKKIHQSLRELQTMPAEYPMILRCTVNFQGWEDSSVLGLKRGVPEFERTEIFS